MSRNGHLRKKVMGTTLSSTPIATKEKRIKKSTNKHLKFYCFHLK